MSVSTSLCAVRPSAYARVGGLEALYYKYMEAVPAATATAANATFSSTCGLPRHDAFHVFRDPVHSDLPWPGVMVRATLASLWFWCADQVRLILIFFFFFLNVFNCLGVGGGLFFWGVGRSLRVGCIGFISFSRDRCVRFV